MEAVSKIVKKRLNEDVTIMGVKMKSPIQQKMSDITDTDKDLPFKYKQPCAEIQKIYDRMWTSKYGFFLGTCNIEKTIEWSFIVSTAATDGYKGRLIMNPDFILQIYDSFGDTAVQFIILHECMHVYYNNFRHAQEITTPVANINVDRQINNEIIRRWPEFKDVPKQIGALL